MRVAYSDPPYLGQGVRHYGDRHENAAEFDTLDGHRHLIDRMVAEFPDGRVSRAGRGKRAEGV